MTQPTQSSGATPQEPSAQAMELIPVAFPVHAGDCKLKEVVILKAQYDMMREFAIQCLSARNSLRARADLADEMAGALERLLNTKNLLDLTPIFDAARSVLTKFNSAKAGQK